MLVHVCAVDFWNSDHFCSNSEKICLVLLEEDFSTLVCKETPCASWHAQTKSTFCIRLSIRPTTDRKEKCMCHFAFQKLQIVP